jgi:hypothetical protein
MQINNVHGCALCDATWGEYWDFVEGEKMRFCCSTCASAFRNMIAEVKKTAGWPRLDRLEIHGNNTVGRRCLATCDKNTLSFYIKFNDDGSIFDFHSL